MDKKSSHRGSHSRRYKRIAASNSASSLTATPPTTGDDMVCKVRRKVSRELRREQEKSLIEKKTEDDKTMNGTTSDLQNADFLVHSVHLLPCR